MAETAFIFDMDGTLLHSLPDLALAANDALKQMGFPARSEHEIEMFMGTGSSRMIECALPPGASPEHQQAAFELWRSIYLKSDYSHTSIFPGIKDVLMELRNRGVKTAVLSNKFDEGVHTLSERFFPGMFDMVRGEIPGMPRKPDPTSLLDMIDKLGATTDTTAYIGDTRVDIAVARNAGAKAVGVSWGYDAAAPISNCKLDAYVQDAFELLECVTLFS